MVFYSSVFLVTLTVFNGLLYAITSTAFNEHIHLIQDGCHFCDAVLHLMGFIGITQKDAVIILKLVRIEGPHVVCIIVMWTKGDVLNVLTSPISTSQFGRYRLSARIRLHIVRSDVWLICSRIRTRLRLFVSCVAARIVTWHWH